MRKVVCLVLSVILFVMMSGVVLAAERMHLGQNNFTVKLDSLHFSDDALKGLDTTLYVGLEGYGNLGQNVYLGAEVGYVDKDGRFRNAGMKVDAELIYVPVELNVKYAANVVSGLVVDLGGGFSCNYAKVDISEGESDDSDDWLLGGQVFADLNYRIGQFFLGLNAKYQVTGSGEDFGYNFNNVRVGGQAGVIF